MRRLILGLALLGFAPSAFAADYGAPYLRGSQVYEPGRPAFYDWSGSYVGLQAGYSNAHTTFSEVWGSLVPVLAGGVVPLEPPLGRRGNGSGASYGGFVGFNSQWDEVVLGLELSYSHTSLRPSTTATVADPAPATVTAGKEMHVTDFATFRGRAGYVMGRYLPYAMIGFAMGRAEQVRTALVIPAVGGPLGPISDSNPKWAYGYAAGIGLDVMVMQNMFLRAEYEFVQFVNNIDTSINTVRAALGLRF